MLIFADPQSDLGLLVVTRSSLILIIVTQQADLMIVTEAPSPSGAHVTTARALRMRRSTDSRRQSWATVPRHKNVSTMHKYRQKNRTQEIFSFFVFNISDNFCDLMV